MGNTSDLTTSGCAAWGLSLLLAVVAGCGDDESKTAAGSGVPGTKTGAQLTDAEAVKLCIWADKQLAGVEPTKQQSCIMFGLATSETEAMCKEAAAECEALPEVGEEPTDGEDDCAGSTKDDIGGAACTATVAEIEACIREQGKWLETLLADASCADAGKDQEQEPPPACKKLETSCPSIFEDDEEEEEEGDAGEFMCDAGATTLDAEAKCDDAADCMDGADEAGCP